VQSNPNITVYRGGTYNFTIANALEHPMCIRTQVDGANLTESDGVLNNCGAASPNVLLFVVPGSAPDLLVYQCSVHNAMFGYIFVLDAPTPAPTQSPTPFPTGKTSCSVLRLGE
jgi:hypothetical protein